MAFFSMETSFSMLLRPQQGRDYGSICTCSASIRNRKIRLSQKEKNWYTLKAYFYSSNCQKSDEALISLALYVIIVVYRGIYMKSEEIAANPANCYIIKQNLEKKKAIAIKYRSNIVATSCHVISHVVFRDTSARSCS